MEGNSAAVSPKIEMVLLNLVGSVGRWWVPLPALMGLCSCKHWRRVHARNGSSLSRPDYQSDRPNNNKITLLWDLPGLLTNLFFLGCCERMKICSLVIAWNHNCYGIWGMKFIVRNMVSRNIMVLNILSSWSTAHTRKIFVLTLHSFPWVGVLNVQCPCFPPVLPGGQGIPWGDFPSLYHADTPVHKGTIFLEHLQEDEKLWDVERSHAKGSFFSCEVSPSSLLMSRPWKHWSADVLIRQTDWLWWATHMTEHCGLGLPGLAEMILCLVKSVFSPRGACGAASCWLAGSSRHASKQIPALG